MQAELEQGLLKQIQAFKGKSIGGWKVGLTSGVNRDGMGKGFRPFGHVLQDQIFDSGTQLELDLVGSIGVENELCFEFGDAIKGDASRDQVMAGIKCVLPAFELNERRLPNDATSAQRLADNLSQWGIVCGEAYTDWNELDFDALQVSLFKDQELVQKVVAHNHIDNHVDSLVALVENLGHFGLSIQAGHRVITGAFGRSQVEGPSRWLGDFGEQIGTVEVNWI